MKQNSLNVKEKKLSKVAFSHVGCEKNLVDTEHMQGLLDREGYEVESNINDANVVVVNTCSFIETAVSIKLQVFTTTTFASFILLSTS